MKRRVCVLLACALVLSLALPAVAAAAPRVQGKVPAGIRPTAILRGDSYDSVDDTWTTAPTLPMDSYHELKSEQDYYLSTIDQDWFKVTVTETDTPISVYGSHVSGLGGSYIDVFGSDAAGRCDTESIAFGEEADHNNYTWPLSLGSYDPAGWWMSSTAKIYFVAPAPGTYYFRVRADDPEGPGVDRDLALDSQWASYAYDLHVVVGSADRFAGPNRYATAVSVTRQMWDGADDPWWWEGPWGDGVIVASGENYADGLAATALSMRTGNPLLLTKKGYLPSDVAAEIDRLGWDTWTDNDDFTVYICGSESAVSQDVEDAIADLNVVGAVVRLAGDDRYETAAAIADETMDTALDGDTTSGRAFVVNGYAWADGLAAGPVAAWAHAPVLMCAKSALPSATADWIEDNNVTEIYIVGSTSTISTDVVDAIADLSTSPSVQRVWGDNRYETAYELAVLGVEDFGMTGGSTIVVSGESPWDALSAGQMSLMTDSPLLLTPRAALSPYVEDFYMDYGPFENQNYVVGGEASVSAPAFKTLFDMWKTPRSG